MGAIIWQFLMYKFVMHVANKQFSDEFNNGWFIAICHILRQ